MNYIIAAVGEYGSILLGVGRHTRLGGIAVAITGIIFGIFVSIRQSRKIARYKGKKQRMTKRINVVITQRERKEMRETLDGKIYRTEKYRYIYTFTGMGEYEGIIFYDESLLLKNAHVEGEKVSLLINEYNLKEFWFEEEEEPGKGILIGAILIFLCAVYIFAFTIRDWDSLPWT